MLVSNLLSGWSLASCFLAPPTPTPIITLSEDNHVLIDNKLLKKTKLP